MRKKLALYSYPYILWSLILIVFPLLLICLFSIIESHNSGESLVFTLRGYGTFLTPLYLKILGFSLVMALGTTLICLLLAYPIALCINREEENKKRNIMLLLMVPMWINFLIKTYAWKPILKQDGLLNQILNFLGAGPVEILYTKGAILLGLVYNFLPFMILPILNSLMKIDNRLIEAACDLGSNKIRLQTRIILPLTLPGLFSGITMVFMPSISTFLIPIILGGGQDLMIGNIVEHQFLKTADTTFGSSISILLILIMMSLMTLMNYFNRARSESV